MQGLDKNNKCSWLSHVSGAASVATIQMSLASASKWPVTGRLRTCAICAHLEIKSKGPFAIHMQHTYLPGILLSGDRVSSNFKRTKPSPRSLSKSYTFSPVLARLWLIHAVKVSFHMQSVALPQRQAMINSTCSTHSTETPVVKHSAVQFCMRVLASAT